MAFVLQQMPDGNNVLVDTSTGLPATPATPRTSYGYDLAPYQDLLTYAARRFDPQVVTGETFVDPNSVTPWVPDQLFNFQYGGRYANVNPYYTTQIRDVLRQASGLLGLTAEDADKAALQFATDQFHTFGQPYSEATHPALVADAIAAKLFQQAGVPYQGFTPEQYQTLNDEAGGYQQHLKEWDKRDWEKDDIGGALAFIGQVMQDRWEILLNDPERAATPGPISTWLQNKILNKDNDPVTDIWGGATNEDFKKAQEAGINTGAAGGIQWWVEGIAAILAGQALGAGLAASGAGAAAGEASASSGLTAAEAAALAGAIQGAAGAVNTSSDASVGDVLEGALKGALAKGGAGAAAEGADIGISADAANTAAQLGTAAYKYSKGDEQGALADAATYAGKNIKVGDFDSSAFSGGDSPYNQNSLLGETDFGNNYAGSNMYDEYGNWIDGEYDQYGNFVPNDQTTFGDDYGEGYGRGNDIYGGGNLEDSNPELFTGDPATGGGGILSALKGLLGGAGDKLSGLFSGGTGGTGGNNLIALAPILAAIQHARQQGPFDTSRLTGLADSYSPNSMAYQYDRNTEDQRRALTSSLADRGVMGSSFGNMDIANFDTNRELGRGALVSQASLGGADIANKILQAQIQQRQLQNQMYGSALYALGNVFGGRRS